MRIVRPDDNVRLPRPALEMRRQFIERLGHVPVAQVPARDPSAKHCPVVLLGVDNQPRVLLGEEVGIRSGQAV
jgi:hypothetical protein